MKIFSGVLLTAVATVGALPVAQAGFSYQESVSGDLSNNRLIPSVLAPTIGSNTLKGTFGPSAVPDVPDLDYVTLTVPTGTVLHQIVLTQASVGGAFSFIGVEQGSQVSVPYTTSDASTLLGWHHFGSSDVGTDILPSMSGGAGAQGFIPPLGAGSYTFWIMELDQAFSHSYGFDFRVAAVPEPSTWAISGTGLAVLGAMLGRRRRKG